MEELYEKLANKTLTIGEAVELGVYKATTASMKNNIGNLEKTLNKIGFSSDLPLTILEEESSIKKIADQYDIEGGGEPFKDTKSLWKRLETAAKERDFAPTYLKEPFAHGKEQGFHTLTGDQRRKTKKMARVPEAKITFKGMLSAIAEIEDPQARAAVLANMFIPIRPGEIANLRTDEIDFIEVSLDDGSKVLTAEISQFSRGEGGRPIKTRPFLEVQGPAAEVLRHQANLAQQRGDNMLFVTTNAKGQVKQLTTGDMSAATGTAAKPGPMSRFFNDNEQLVKVLGRKFSGAAEIRKFVPSIIARQLGYGAIADKIMGHSGAGLAEGISEVGDKHYISDIYYEGDVGPEGKALLANQHLIAEVNDVQTLNALPKAVGIDIPGYTDSNEVTPVQKFKREQNIEGDFRPRPATPTEIENRDLVTQDANEKLKASITESRRRGEVAETARQQAIVDRGPISEDAARIKVQEQETKNQARRNIQEQKKAETAAAEGAERRAKLKKALAAAKKTLEIGGKAVGVLAVGDIAARTVSAAMEGKYGQAAATASELAVPLPAGEMYEDIADPEKRQLRQEQQTRYGEGKPVFGETVQKGAQKVREQVGRLFNEEEDPEELLPGEAPLREGAASEMEDILRVNITK